MGVAKQSAQTLIFKILGTAITVAVGVLVARTLGPAGKGQAAVATTAPVMLAFLFDLGLPSAVVYFIGQKDCKPREFFFTVSLVSIGAGSLISVACWFLRSLLLASVLQGLDDRTLIPVLASVPMAMWINGMAAMILGRNYVWEFNLSVFVSPAVLLTGTIIGVSVLHGGVYAFVVASLCGLIARSLVSFYYVIRLVGTARVLRGDLARDLLSYGWQSYLGSAISQLNNRVDLYLVNMLGGNWAAGIYSLGVNFAEMMYQVPEALRTVIHPKLVADTDYANRATPKACRQMTLILGAISLLGLAVAKPVILLLYGERFLPAILPYALLLPGVVALSQARLLFADLQSRGKPIITAYASAIGLAPKVGLTLLLVPVMGLAGAAVASSISYVITDLYSAAAFSRFSKTPIGRVFLPRRSDAEVYTEAWGKLRGRLKQV